MNHHDIVRALSRGETLPEKNKDYALSGNWEGHRECHILPDWLLIYRIEDDLLILTLARTGRRSPHSLDRPAHRVGGERHRENRKAPGQQKAIRAQKLRYSVKKRRFSHLQIDCSRWVA